MKLKKVMKEEIYFVSHVIPDKYTEEGTMKRMQFYGNFPKKPFDFYFGESFRTSFPKEKMKEWTKSGKLIELLEHTPLKKEKDLWFDSKGQIFLADAVNPIKDTNKEYLGKYKQFTKAYQLAHKIELPEISFIHTIE